MFLLLSFNLCSLALSSALALQVWQTLIKGGHFSSVAPPAIDPVRGDC
jgi:hypothetical protein